MGQWFGGRGNKNTEQVRREILRTFNFVNREFAQGFYFIVPADNTIDSPCNRGIAAYVWKAKTSRPATGYVETTAPRCSSRDNPRTKQCALDQNGKYYVYLCSAFLSQPEDYQVGVLIHEAAHHAGPTDVTYKKDQMRRESQFNQLMNAANYQYFAQQVTDEECADKDGNCGNYQRWCDQARIKSLCKKTCGGCSSCADEDGNCRHYTQWCNTDRIKGLCKKTCGVCGSGGGPPPCTDTYGTANCQYYKENNWYKTANVLAQCKRTCGACR